MNIGIDIVENERLKDKSDDFINLILTSHEKEEYKKRGNTYLYGRFAAKEAIMKALPNTKELNFLDIEILTNIDGSPKVTTNSNSNNNIKVSISHEKNYSVAIAIITE